MKIKKIKIGILGGTFDPAHRGHLTISKLAKKEFSLDYVVWAITKKNPFKSKSSLSLEKRIKIAKKITQSLKIPTIGIGSSVHCDGQVLVTDDLIGLNNTSIRFVKKFVNIKKYLNLGLRRFALEVKSKKYPQKKHSY